MNKRIPELDGIRGIAILLVLIVHFARVENLQEPLVSLVNFGWAGVDLFFVLSGFLITSILLKSKSEAEYYRVFYTNRVLRIFPLYYTFLAVCVVIGIAPVWQQVAYWLYFGNFMNSTGNLIPAMHHFWSLAIEEQFYVFWPLVVRKASTPRLARLCVAMIAITVAARFAVVHFHLPSPEFVYTLTPLRWDSLLFGGLVACLHEHRTLARISWAVKWVAIAGAATLCLGVYRGHGTWYTSPNMERFGYLGSDLLFTSLIAAVVLWRESQWFAVARSRFLWFFGKYSYGIYVFHYPISRYLVNAIVPGVNPMLRAVVSLTVGTVLSVAAALVSWKLIEKHCLKRKVHFADHQGTMIPMAKPLNTVDPVAPDGADVPMSFQNPAC